MEVFSFDVKNIIASLNLHHIQPDRVTWIRLVDPREDQIKAVSELAKIPQEEFKEFLEDEEHSRLEHGRFLEIVFHVPMKDNGDIETEPLNIFISGNMLITLERKTCSVTRKMSELLKKGKLRFLLRKNVGDFLHYLIDKINDEFLYNIEKIANLTEILSHKEMTISKDNLSKLYQSTITLSIFNQSIIANVDVLNGLRKSYYKKFTKDNLEDYADLYYDALQIRDTEKVQRDVITNLFNFQTVMSSNRLNAFMKKLTALALIIMVPTFITSLYGMNVALPFDKDPYAFWYLCGIMIVLTIILYVVFEKIDWV